MADEEKPAEIAAPKNGAASPVVIKLKKSVIANGDEVNELTFREPTTADIERVGNPITIDFMSSDTPKVTYNDKVMVQMLSVLAAVPPSTIRQMNTRDYESAKLNLTSFFMPEW